MLQFLFDLRCEGSICLQTQFKSSVVEPKPFLLALRVRSDRIMIFTWRDVEQQIEAENEDKDEKIES